MAGFIYDEYRNSLGGQPTHSVIDWHDDTLKGFFVDEGTDTPNQATDVDAADRTGAFPAYASGQAIAGSSSVSSNVLILDASDTTFTALDTSSTTVESLDIWKEGGTEATSPLISNHDDYTNMPFTGTGGDVVVTWAATGIIRI